MIDSHCHTAGKEFDADRDAVLARAWQAGLTQLIVIGAGDGLEGNAGACALADREPRVMATVGIHPHDAALYTADTLDTIRVLARTRRVVAIGEIGLDYHYTHAPAATQQGAFRAQLALAAELNLPVAIHTREADTDILTILRDTTPRPHGVIHCFTGTLAFAQQCLDLGFYLSIPGVLTFKKSDTLRDTIRQLPPDRLLIETDSPYLAPVPYRGKRNEPAYIVETLNTLAPLLNLSPDACAQLTTANTRRCFNLPTPTVNY
ncbi:MAG: TatD family hydrolase [Deltaproteobacteria bacterium]|nr:TatD family hydrolase [Deltaproteobacteria bacterium]